MGLFRRGKDPYHVGTFQFGRIPTNREAIDHKRAQSQPKRDEKAARRKLVQLERERDKWYPGSARYKDYDKEIRRFKAKNGL